MSYMTPQRGKFKAMEASGLGAAAKGSKLPMHVGAKKKPGPVSALFAKKGK